MLRVTIQTCPIRRHPPRPNRTSTVRPVDPDPHRPSPTAKPSTIQRLPPRPPQWLPAIMQPPQQWQRPLLRPPSQPVALGRRRRRMPITCTASTIITDATAARADCRRPKRCCATFRACWRWPRTMRASRSARLTTKRVSAIVFNQ